MSVILDSILRIFFNDEQFAKKFFESFKLQEACLDEVEKYKDLDNKQVAKKAKLMAEGFKEIADLLHEEKFKQLSEKYKQLAEICEQRNEKIEEILDFVYCFDRIPKNNPV